MNMYEGTLQLLMPHPVPIFEVKESVIVSDAILEEILEGMFWTNWIGCQ